MKEKIISYIEKLEAKSLQVDDYFKQRNELYISNQEKDKEIERLNNELKLYKDNHEHLNNLLQQKENIIKEVREKLLCYGETFDNKIHQEMQKELLEKLDKVGSEKE